MRKVLYIDIWDKGYRNFTRIDDDFKKNDFTTLLVHTGSFYSNDTIDETLTDGLLVRDIRFYKTILIKTVIEIEKPDVIIILNLSFVFDRTVVNICKSKKVKIVYLSHGKLISPEVELEESKKLNNAIWGNLNRIFRKKNFLVFINYFSSLTGMKIFMNPIQLILGIIRKPSNYLTFARYEEELDADLMLVYTQEDKDLLSESFGFPETKIKVVGNPEITAFMLTPSLLKSAFLLNLGLNVDSKYVVYLDDGLVCDKMITVDEWYESLSEIVEITQDLGLKMIMKLHPRTEMEQHQLFFDRENILSIRDCDFKNLLDHSEFVISHLSTTILYALIFNKNVYIPYWNKFAGFWKNYPEDVVKYCYSITDFNQAVSANINENSERIHEYLLDNGIDNKVNSINNIVREVVKLF